jgi:hypothetical protein
MKVINDKYTKEKRKRKKIPPPQYLGWSTNFQKCNKISNIT